MHRGGVLVDQDSGGDGSKLNEERRDTVDTAIDSYGAETSQWLSDLTHMEAPWIDARRKAGLQRGERGNAEIPLGSMDEYCGDLQGNPLRS